MPVYYKAGIGLTFCMFWLGKVASISFYSAGQRFRTFNAKNFLWAPWERGANFEHGGVWNCPPLQSLPISSREARKKFLFKCAKLLTKTVNEHSWDWRHLEIMGMMHLIMVIFFKTILVIKTLIPCFGMCSTSDLHITSFHHLDPGMMLMDKLDSRSSHHRLCAVR